MAGDKAPSLFGITRPEGLGSASIYSLAAPLPFQSHTDQRRETNRFAPLDRKLAAVVPRPVFAPPAGARGRHGCYERRKGKDDGHDWHQ